MMVPDRSAQHDILLEAVQNHNPQVCRPQTYRPVLAGGRAPGGSATGGSCLHTSAFALLITSLCPQVQLVQLLSLLVLPCTLLVLWSGLLRQHVIFW